MPPFCLLLYKEQSVVISDLKVRMGEALRLTGAGRLAEATALLQGLPQNVKSPEVSKGIKRESTTRAGRAGQLIDMVPPRSASGHWTAPGMDTQEHDAALAEGVAPPTHDGCVAGIA